MKKRPYEKPELLGIEALAGGRSSDDDDRGGHGHTRTCCRRTGHACNFLVRRSFGKRRGGRTAS